MDFAGTLPGGYAAHTKPDRGTGELHAIAYYWAWGHVQHVVIDAAGRVSRTTDIPVSDGPMMHDFALTGKYVVLFDLPVTFSMDAVSAGRQLPYTWNPAHEARVGLLPRDGSVGDIRWLAVAPASADAAEDDGYVLAFIHNPDRGGADLVILSAQDFTGEPVARVHLPARIPLGFHGSWISDR